jgi:hypothetical protein
MDAYISEAQIMSCDGVDELIADLIQPGHKTICSANWLFAVLQLLQQVVGASCLAASHVC